VLSEIYKRFYLDVRLAFLGWRCLGALYCPKWNLAYFKISILLDFGLYYNHKLNYALFLNSTQTNTIYLSFNFNPFKYSTSSGILAN
jgi:hypothetical protein